MNGSEIRSIRQLLGLNQAQFAQLMGVHAITVSKWESGITSPTDYQQAFLSQYRVAAAKNKQVRDELKGVLIAAGVIAAVILLLNASKK